MEGKSRQTFSHEVKLKSFHQQTYLRSMTKVKFSKQKGNNKIWKLGPSGRKETRKEQKYG